MKITVLIVDDDEGIRMLCCDALSESGLEVVPADCGSAGLAFLEGGQVDIVLTDLQMPGMSGLELLQKVRESYPDTDVVMMTGHGSIQTAIEAIRLGAYDYITKPFAVDELVALVHRLVERRELMAENLVLRAQLKAQKGLGDMIGTSPPMQALFRLLMKVAPKRHPVLITGESGTGKELIARAVHGNSPWKDLPFVPVDCGALSANIIESELFGHVRGAFTGATHDREGLLAAAGQGTVFLDEIGELPIELQAKLLRALQEREFRPIGGNRRVRLEARIIAATNRNLEDEVKAGKFREDLYFRLNVFHLEAPSLRQRKTDIPVLAHYFVERERVAGDVVMGIAPEALALLTAYDWPGNVRELENYVKRSMAVCEGAWIQPKDLPAQLRLAAPAMTDQKLSQMEDMERRAILKMLEATGGDRVRAAKALGIGKTTIYRKLKEYGLQEIPAETGK